MPAIVIRPAVFTWGPACQRPANRLPVVITSAHSACAAAIRNGVRPPAQNVRPAAAANLSGAPPAADHGHSAMKGWSCQVLCILHASVDFRGRPSCIAQPFRSDAPCARALMRNAPCRCANTSMKALKQTSLHVPYAELHCRLNLSLRFILRIYCGGSIVHKCVQR